MSKQTLEEALQEIKDTARPIFEPRLTRFMEWLDRQLRRSPRLYRWLSR